MERLSTGNADLDLIVGGGLPRHSINVVMGLPGTGKTILAQQLAFANGTPDRPVLYLTTVSEPLAKVVTYLQEMEFAEIGRLGTDVRYESIAEALRERPDGLVDAVTALLQQHRPGVLVIDSFKAVMELVPSAMQWRTTVFDLAGLLTAYDVLALWVGEYEHEAVSRLPEFAVADGILELRRTQTGSSDDRFLQVIKLRGSGFRDGEHAFTLSRRGLTVFPRLIGPAGDRYEPLVERLQTGIEGLDAMIEAGWLRGTSTLIAGPSGAGKTMTALHFLRHGAERGEAGLLINFQESPTQLRRAMDSLGWQTEQLLQPGRLDVYYSSPVELQLDTIIQEVFRRIDAHRVRRVVIDAIGDLATAASDPRRFTNYIYALTQELAVRRITSMLVLEAPGETVSGQIKPGTEISYMCDNIVLLSMNLDGDLVRKVRIIKTRGSAHDGARHVLRISDQGIVVE